MKMIKLFLISNSAKGEYTGRLSWANKLQEHGFDVSFVLPNEEEDYIRKIELEGVTAYRWCLKRGKKHFTNKLLAICDLYSIVKQGEPSIIHSFGHEANICCAIVGRLCGINNIVLHVTGLGSEFTGRTSLVGRLVFFLYRLISLSTYYFLFENEDDYRLFSFIPNNLKSIIPASGIDTKFFSTINVDQRRVCELRDELQTKYGDIVVTFIGRLLKHKGIYELVKSWHEISKITNSAHLLIIGEVDKDNPSSLEESDIEWFSQIRNIRMLYRRDDIRELLFLTDIFVNPSYREGLPRTNIEAMSMGRPIITTEAAGCRDTVQDRFNGILIPVGDYLALTEAITELMGDQELRSDMGRNGRARAENEFSVDVVLRKVEEIYEYVLKKE